MFLSTAHLPMFFPTNDTKFRTHTEQQAAYNSAYFNLIFLESKWDEKRFWIKWKQTFHEFNLLLVFTLCNFDLLVPFPNKSMSWWCSNGTAYNM
jgi:hypothetical protein